MKFAYTRIVVLYLFFISLPIHSQNEPCIAKIVDQDCYECEYDFQLILNKKDTVRSTNLGIITSAHLCKLKHVLFLQSITSYNGKQKTGNYSYQSSEFYNDTLFIYVEADLNNRRLASSKASNNLTQVRSFQENFDFEPGVRWETRGLDGSPFLNIRGSGFRANHGVRNVKLYYQNIPLSTPDGSNQFEFLEPYFINTYRNHYNQYYGMGNGGSLNSFLKADSTLGKTSLDFSTQVLIGSYGYKSYGGQFTFKNKKLLLRGGFIHKESKGYRELEYINRKNAFLHANYSINEFNNLELNVLYSYNNWGLPGSLSLEDFESGPKAANLYSKNILAHLEKNQVKAGLTHTYQKKRFALKNTIYLGWSNSYNPYGTSVYNNGIKRDSSLQLGFIQSGEYKILDKSNAQLKWYYNFENRVQLLNFNERAISDSSLKSNGKLWLTQHILNSGLHLDIKSWDIYFYGQLIWNYFELKNQHSQHAVHGSANVSLRYLTSKKSSLGIHIGQSLSVANWDEIISSDGSINILKPEKRIFLSLTHGYQSQPGEKFTHKFVPELYVWYFYDFITPYTLNGIDIVKFKNTGDAVNAGFSGIYTFSFDRTHTRIKNWGISLHANYGFQYYYVPRIESENQTYLKKRLTGMPMHTGGLQFSARIFRFEFMMQAQASDKILLNYSNTVSQKAYALVDLEIRYRQPLFKVLIADLFFQVNNITNTKYSSRLTYNDPINRYYNAAPGTNFKFGFILRTKNMLQTKHTKI